MSFQNNQNGSMSTQQGYMTNPSQPTPPSNGSQFLSDCSNQFRGHSYQAYPNQECPPDMPAPNVAVSQPGHGQALTLNQLLLQNNSPGPQPTRVPGAMSLMSGYRYDPYGYMPKSGHQQDGNPDPAMQENMLRSSRANTPQEGGSAASVSQPDQQSQGQMDLSGPKSQPNRTQGGPSPCPPGYPPGIPPQGMPLRTGAMPPGGFAPTRPGYPPDYGQDPYAAPYAPMQRYPPPPASSRYATPGGGGYSMMPPPPPPGSAGYPPGSASDYQKMWPYNMMPDHSQSYSRPPYPPDMYGCGGGPYPPMSNGVSPPPRGPPPQLRYSHPAPPSEGVMSQPPTSSQQDQSPVGFPQPQSNRAESRDESMSSRVSCSSEQASSLVPPGEVIPPRPPSSSSASVRTGPSSSPKKEEDPSQQQVQQPPQNTMPQHHQYVMQQQMHPMYRHPGPNRMPPRGPHPGGVYGYPGYPPNFPPQQQQYSQQPYPGEMPPNVPPMYHQPHPQSSTHYGHQYSPYNRGVYPPSQPPQQPPPSQGMHAMAHPPPNLSPQTASCFSRLMEMGFEPERRQWLEHYFFFMEEVGKPLTGLPQVVKQPLDLYRFYLAVRERGGVLEVIKTKRWKEISQLFNINASASAAYTLRKNYCKYLLDYECRFDHGPGGADVRAVAAQIETLSGKKKKTSVGSIGGGGSEMNESSTSSSTPFPPPSPVGSQSSASSNLMPPVQQPPSNGASTGGVSGALVGGGATDDGGGGKSGSPLGGGGTAGSGMSPAPSSAAASPYPVTAPPPTASAVSSSMPMDQQQSPSVYPMAPGAPPTSVSGGGGGMPWRPPSVGPNQRSPFPPPGYPQSRMPGPGVGYGCDMVGRHPYPPPPTPYGRPSGGPGGGSHLMAAMEGGMRGEPPGPDVSTKPPQMAPGGNTVHHPPQPQQQQSMMYHHQRPPPQPYMGIMGPQQQGPSQALAHQQSQQPPPPPPPPSFTAHYQPLNVSRPGMPGMGGPPRHPMPPFSGYSAAQVPPPNTVLMPPSQQAQQQQHQQPRMHHPQPPPQSASLMAQQAQQQQQQGQSQSQMPPQHPGMMAQQRPGGTYVTTAAAAAAYWKRLEAAQLFPPGCVEATPIDSGRRKRYRIKDLGNLTASKLVMALKSGLPAETTWALNALNVILRDEPNVLEAYFAPPSQQPLFAVNANAPTLTTLVTSLTDHLRRAASELFPHHHLISELELPLHLDSETSSLTSTDPPPLDIQTSSVVQENRLIFVDVFSEVVGKNRRGQNQSTVPPNGLISLEREIAAMAHSMGISVSALREAIKQLLQGKNARLLLKAAPPKLPKPAQSALESNLDKPGSGLLGKRGRGRGSASSLLAEHLAAFEASNALPAPIVTPPKHTAATLFVNNLSGPEARSNIRRLALFVLDELMEGKESPPPVLVPAEDVGVELTSPPSSPLPSSMREVFLRGGSDSTAYILPHPNGCRNTDADIPTHRKRAISSNEAASGCEKASKRARSSSSSSSSLPVLSPQKVDLSTDKNETDSVPAASEPVTAVGEDDEDSELNSHRLMTDSRGYCPLRARSEIIRRGDSALWPVDSAAERAEGFALRCLCVSTVLRNLSFLPSCERVLANHKALLALAGRLLTVAHTHFDSPEVDWACVEDHSVRYDSNSAWWMPWQDELCENILVLLVNISGHLQCIPLHETIIRSILEGLIHWVTCQTAAATDPLPGHRIISPCRLALESLNRLSVSDSNVAMLLATMDNASARRLFDRLASWLSLPEDQVTRELALSTMHYLSEPPANICQQQVDGSNASTYGLSMIAEAKPCPVTGLIAFIEIMEAKTRRVIDQYGVQALQEQPELMGTSLELLRRAGALLERLAANTFGRSRFTPDLELRILGLATSRVLDATVAQLLSGCLLNLPQRDSHSNGICDLIPKMPSAEKVAELLKSLEKEKEVEASKKEVSRSCEMKAKTPESSKNTAKVDEEKREPKESTEQSSATTSTNNSEVVAAV